MPQLNVYNLGKRGVNVDKSPVHLEDGELTEAQNAVPDKFGAEGALCKRPGLIKHAASVAAGSILGFIGVPLGSGPGATTDDARVYYAAVAGGTWLKSSNSFSTSAAVSTVGALDAHVPSVMLNGKLYYASGLNIRVFDGVVDAKFCGLLLSIVSLSAVEGELYASVSNSGGYVYRIDSAGRAYRIGAVIPASYIPHDLVKHQNDLFACCTKAGSVSIVYRIRLHTATGTTAWVADFTSADVDSDLHAASFKSLLYVCENTAGVTAAKVWQRSTAGVYSAVETGTTGGGAAAGANSIVVYQGKLYVHWDHFVPPTNASYIRRSTDGSTWATVTSYTPSDAGGIATLFDAGSKLFSVGRDQTKLLYSAAGASWTEVALSANTDSGFGFFKASGSGPSFGATSSFVVLQGASSLQLLNQAGTLATLTLPTGITLDTSRPPRFAVFNKFVVMVNTPSRPIMIDADGIARVLTPQPPIFELVLDDDGGAGALTGSYKAVQTFIIQDREGNILSESDFSPEMETAFAVVAKTLDAESLNFSSDDITGSRLYRTTAGGSTYFPWIDVDGNVLTQSVSDEQTDAELSLVAAPTLGTAPNLSLVGTFRGRLWGVDRADVDNLVYSESGIAYSWPNTNRIPIGMIGSDARGITAIIPRRDALGIGRRNGLFQVTGTLPQDFRPVTLGENLSVESQESVRVHRDIAYFLGKDGVYSWGPNGVKCISDGKVSAWFNTDNYFNRSRFQYSFATLDPLRNRYRLYMAYADSSAEDTWVEYDITDGTWWGRHATDAFDPTSADWTTDSSGLAFALVGSSSGYLWKDQDTRTDNTATPILLDVVTKQHDGETPNIAKVFEHLTISQIPQTKGRLLITPSVGELNGPVASQNLQADLTDGSVTVGMVGPGEVMRLRFREETAGQNVQLLGYEVPWFELGNRS